jgi:hypothetical protein
MPDKRLDHQHPALDAQEPKYRVWNDLYHGGDNMEAQDKAKKYLPRHPYETTKQYDIRLQRATYRNHAAPIVQVFSSSVTEGNIKRVLPPQVKELTQDVDRSGSTANQFFNDVITKAAARGVQFVVVDSPQGEAQNLAEAQAQGIRPYFVQIEPWHVLDWQFGEDGRLDWVKLYEYVETGADPFEGHQFQEQYRIWYRDRWELWVQEDNGNGGTDIRQIDEGNNPTGRVPLVPFYFERSQLMVGTSALDDVSSLCKRVFMRDSELDKNLFDSAVEIACFYGFEEDELDQFIRASTNGLRSSSADSKVEYAAPTGRAWEALRRAINEDEERIREIALRMVRPDSKQVESAESKREDRKQLNSQLERFARNCEAGEEQCWGLAAAWMNAEGAEIEITYDKDFNEDDISEQLMKSFVDIRRNRDLSRETFLRLLHQWGWMPEDFDVEQEIDRIAEETRNESRTVGRLGGGLMTTREQQSGQTA